MEISKNIFMLFISTNKLNCRQIVIIIYGHYKSSVRIVHCNVYSVYSIGEFLYRYFGLIELAVLELSEL